MLGNSAQAATTKILLSPADAADTAGATSDWVACADAEGAKLEDELSSAVNMLGVGPQGLGGDATAFAVHVELAATRQLREPRHVHRAQLDGILTDTKKRRRIEPRSRIGKHAAARRSLERGDV